MKSIHQTPFGAFLCWLGLHLVVRTGQNVDQYGNTFSAWGGCIRCNAGWQWDN